MDRIRVLIAGTGLAIAVTILLTLLLGIQPRLNEISTNNEALAAVDQRLSAQQQNLAAMIKLSENQDELTSQLEALSSSIPNQMATSEFVNVVNTIASRSRVSISEIIVGEPVLYLAPDQVLADSAFDKAIDGLTTRDLFAIDVTMNVVGSLDSVQEFVNELQDSPRATLVYQYTIKMLDQKTGLHSLALSAQIFVDALKSSG